MSWHSLSNVLLFRYRINVAVSGGLLLRELSQTKQQVLLATKPSFNKTLVKSREIHYLGLP